MVRHNLKGRGHHVVDHGGVQIGYAILTIPVGLLLLAIGRCWAEG